MFEPFSQCYAAFVAAGAENPALETLHLLDILSQGAIRKLDIPLPDDIAMVAQQRRSGMPLEYILNRATFMGLELHCTPDTLIPRQETELLANVTLTHIRNLQRANGAEERVLTIADIGTGCGNLVLALAVHTKGTELLASDISRAAVEVARGNVQRLQLQERVTLFCGDMLAPLFAAGYANLDVVVCNPPYIPTASLPKLAPEIMDYEPVVALDAGAYGLKIFRQLIAEAKQALRPGGVLAFEIGAGQEKLVQRLLQRNGAFQDIVQHKDDAGAVRVFSAVRKLDDA